MWHFPSFPRFSQPTPIVTWPGLALEIWLHHSPPPSFLSFYFASLLKLFSSLAPLFWPLRTPLLSCSLNSHLSVPSILCPPHPMSMTCTGLTKDQVACTCALFIPRRSKENKCKSCGHWVTSHSNVSISPQDVDPLEGPGVSENKYVKHLFKSLGATAIHETA